MASHPSVARPRTPNSRHSFASARRPKHRTSNLQLLASNFQNLIGTPRRLETHVGHRKQTAAHPSNRYTYHPPVSSPIFPQPNQRLNPNSENAPNSARLKFRCSNFHFSNSERFRAIHPTRRAGSVSSSRHSPLTTHAFVPLPETVNRVETRLTCRKQTTRTCSTRDGSRAGFHSNLLESSDTSCGGVLRQSSPNRLKVGGVSEMAAWEPGTGVVITPGSRAVFEDRTLLFRFNRSGRFVAVKRNERPQRAMENGEEWPSSSFPLAFAGGRQRKPVIVLAGKRCLKTSIQNGDYMRMSNSAVASITSPCDAPHARNFSGCFTSGRK